MRAGNFPPPFFYPWGARLQPRAMGLCLRGLRHSRPFTGLPQRPTGPALARTFRISDLPWADSGFHAAPTSVGIPLLRPVPFWERLQPTNRAVIHLLPRVRARGA